MQWSGPIFILGMMLISTGGWLISSWIRARHGYPLENEWKGKTEKSSVETERRIALLTHENGELIGRLGRLEERLSVMERIVTDPAERTARAIDSLR